MRAGIVTGASSGIGFAIAEMLVQEGYGLTVASRQPDKIEAAAAKLREQGAEIEVVAGNMNDEETIKQVVATHEQRFGRLDVLVNNAGLGHGASIQDQPTKRIDLQIDVNLRAIILFYREAVGLLRKAGAEHRRALVVNTASIAGKRGQGFLSVYSATKAGVVGFTEAMNKELANDGIKSVALCPGFVDTPMSDWVRGQIDSEAMIQPTDIAEAVRLCLKVSPACIIPEIQFIRPGD